MAAEERYRRKQFSSCDTCRASRVRCNRSLPSANDNQDQKCSNCKRRGIPCTFNWLRGAVSRRRTRNRAASYATVEPTLPNSHSPPNLSRSFRSDSTSPATEQPDIARPGQSVCLTSPNLNPTLPLSQSLITSELKNTLWGIFSSIFEPVFAIWLSGDCCPYGNFPNVSLEVLRKTSR
jgi:Fungal Zn(2)-Cys(6) binuclear cluster domain